MTDLGTNSNRTVISYQFPKMIKDIFEANILIYEWIFV